MNSLVYSILFLNDDFIWKVEASIAIQRDVHMTIIGLDTFQIAQPYFGFSRANSIDECRVGVKVVVPNLNNTN
jgi:hypothetical protein